MKFGKRLLSIFAFLLIAGGLCAQAGDVLLQGFNWDSHSNPNGWYNVVQSKAAELGTAGFDMVWLPPPSDAAAPQGYLPRELNDLNSQYGTQAELAAAIGALHANGIKAIADIVVNHRVGTTNWADFTNPTWGCWAVTSNDEWGNNGGNPCGAFDTGDNYHAARDLDHTNTSVRSGIIDWLNYLKSSVGFDGWRYDYVRGYSGYYNKVYNDATNAYFAVGELWDNLDLNNVNAHRQQLVDWIDAGQGSSAAFDFTTKGVLQQAVNGELWRLSINGGAAGLIGWWPGRAVTFVDNHDTGSSQNYWPFPGDKVMQGYAYILTHPGVPSVFWDHYFDWGLKAEIDALIAVRKDNGLTSTSSLDIKVAQGNLYAAEIDGKVAMKIGPGSWSPSGPGWVLRTYGSDYAVWDKTPPQGCTEQLTIHFQKPAGWNTATLYFWNPTPGGTAPSWPGVAMTAEGNGWYVATIDCATCADIIFSDNGANQTADLYTCNESWYANGTWYGSDPGAGSNDLTIHYRPSSYADPELYFWNATPAGTTTSWPGVTMSPEGNGWYGYTLTNTDCTNFIVSNNGSSQSPDLSTCSEIWLEEGQWGAYAQRAPVDLERVADTGPDSELVVWPNPATDRLSIAYTADLADEVELALYNLTGQLVSLQRRGVVPGGQQWELSVATLPAGTYLLRIRSGKENRTTKVVITR